MRRLSTFTGKKGLDRASAPKRARRASGESLVETPFK